MAPYAEQVQTLQEKCAGIAGLDIGTIDKYQGREKQDIVYSAVRGNFKDEIGFLQEQRRLKVALTRSSSLLVVVCNTKLFESDPRTWRPWIAYCRDHR